MANNTVLNAGSGGDTIRDVDKLGVKSPVCIIDVGGAGAEALLTAGQAAMASSVPVAIASNQSPVPVSAAGLPLPAGASTEATLATLNGKVTACNTGAVVLSGALPAGTNPLGTVGLTPQTSGGLSVGRVISAASTNATSVKASAGQVYGYAAFNTNAAWRYLKIYDKASAPVPGTDTPLFVIGIPPGGGANLALPNGIQCTSGIGLAITAGIADADTAAVGAGDCVVNLTYK